MNADIDKFWKYALWGLIEMKCEFEGFLLFFFKKKIESVKSLKVILSIFLGAMCFIL